MKYIVIDPVIFDLGFVKIYWYGVMYLLAFLAAYLLAKYRAKSSQKWNEKQVDDLIFYGALGAVFRGSPGLFDFLQLYNFYIKPFNIF